MLPHVEPPNSQYGRSNDRSLSSPSFLDSSFDDSALMDSPSLQQSQGMPHSHCRDRPARKVHQTTSTPYLPATALDGRGPDAPRSPDPVLDLICVGFGPASLAIAVALHDAVAAGQKLLPDGLAPRVLFIEKQRQFAWHAGMLLAGAKMQISYIKDLATLRDPRSEFTFLNYLHRNGRLVDFSNLGTFLPARAEYEDYLRWSASHFRRQIRYGHEVLSVSPELVAGYDHPVRTFVVESRDVMSGKICRHRGRNVLLATGGQPSFPANFPDPHSHPSIIHSSQFANMVPRILPDRHAPHRVAVVGAGQSAAEIFHNTQRLYPNSRTFLIMRQEFLRPSDDSPFVNTVFDPEYIDTHFSRPAESRKLFLNENRATNYGVVRLELIEKLYETMYEQKLDLGPDERAWPHRILGRSQILDITPSSGRTVIRIRRPRHASQQEGEDQIHEDDDGDDDDDDDDEMTLEVDLLIAATGYRRDAHVKLLRDLWGMLPRPPSRRESHLSHGIQGWGVEVGNETREMTVGRDYKIKFAPGRVERGSGIWLQGCCEGTHGLSDTLLSVLATRSGEMVKSIFDHANTPSMREPPTSSEKASLKEEEYLHND